MKTKSNIILWCLAGSLAGNLILRAYWLFTLSGGHPIEFYRSVGLLYLAVDLANALVGIGGLALLLGYAKTGTRRFLVAAAILFALTPGMHYTWPHAAFAALLFWQAGRAPQGEYEGALEKPALRLLLGLIALEMIWDIWFTAGAFDWTMGVVLALCGLCLAVSVASLVRFRMPLLRAALLVYLLTVVVQFFLTWGVVQVLAPQFLVTAWLMLKWVTERGREKSSCTPGTESIE